MKTILTTLFSFIVISLSAQQPHSIKEILASIETYNSKLPREQLYLHFDKPYYSVGDTIWFKAYLLEATTHSYAAGSGLLYVELLDDSNRVLKLISYPVSYGITWGQIVLNENRAHDGTYTIRAYTNWMQNFGEENFFHQHFLVTDPLNSKILIRENHTVVSGDGKDNIKLRLQLNDVSNLAPLKKDLGLKIMTSKKTLYKQEVSTNMDGILNTEFSIPSNSSRHMSMSLQDKNDPGAKTIIPLTLNRPENIDLQFMPEGGYLLQNVMCRVGFKALNEDGLGAFIEGKVIDENNKEVITFKSIHNGMGLFEFMPLPGEKYAAIINLPGGTQKRYSMPEVFKSGIALKMQNLNNDSLALTIEASPDMTDNQIVHLVGLSRNVICYAANVPLKAGKILGKIAKNRFPSGIAHFTLMNSRGEPLNERMVFIDHKDNLDIRLNAIDRLSPMDSVPIRFKVQDKSGNPVVGSFSLSVTDNKLVRSDSMKAENIITNILLTSDIKGNIEDPWYYLSNNDPIAKNLLDILLLTQGWKGYDWTKIFNPPVPKFIHEPYFAVTGNVTKLFNSPVNKAHVILFSSGAYHMIMDTTTDDKGRFIFTNFPAFDSVKFLLQARNAKGKSFGMGISVNEFKAAEVKEPVKDILMPWFVNTDSIILQYAHNNLIRRNVLDSGGKFKVLKEVRLTGKKKISGSFNLNGTGEADQVIDEAEIEKSGRVSLLEILRKKVKGFREIPIGNGEFSYKINFANLYIIIDGISLNRFGNIRETLDYLDASDVKGIEVMNSMHRSSSYISSFLDINARMNSMTEYAFLEITTFSGNGIFMRKTPGVIVYKPVPVGVTLQFYSPRYSVKTDNNKVTDVRSTIFWNPNLITNKEGEAVTSFYAAGKPSTYTVLIQGSDLNGAVGYMMRRIVIGQ